MSGLGRCPVRFAIWKNSRQWGWLADRNAEELSARDAWSGPIDAALQSAGQVSPAQHNSFALRETVDCPLAGRARFVHRSLPSWGDRPCRKLKMRRAPKQHQPVQLSTLQATLRARRRLACPGEAA